MHVSCLFVVVVSKYGVHSANQNSRFHVFPTLVFLSALNLVTVAHPARLHRVQEVCGDDCKNAGWYIFTALRSITYGLEPGQSILGDIDDSSLNTPSALPCYLFAYQILVNFCACLSLCKHRSPILLDISNGGPRKYKIPHPPHQ